MPILAYGDDAIAEIEWNGLEYTRTEILFVNDKISSEFLNPLVEVSGDIVFELPDELINSSEAPIFVVTAGGERFTCKLKK